MASSINKIILIGHAGKDAELRYTADGRPVASFSMATSESWKDKAGAWQSVTEWHTITAWGDLGERVGGSIKKGDLVYVEGKIKSNKYTGKDGVEKTQYGITANMVKDFTPKEKKEGGSQGTQQQPDNFGDNDFIPEVEDDDVPL